MSTLYVDNLQPNLGSRVMAAGHVVQVVSARDTTRVQGSTSAYQNTGLAITFTPSSANSKLLFIADVSVNLGSVGYSGNTGRFLGRIYNDTDSSAISPEINFWRFDIQGTGSNGLYCYSHPCMQYYANSWGTGAKLIRFQMKAPEGGSQVIYNETYPSGQDSGLTIMEIAQ